MTGLEQLLGDVTRRALDAHGCFATEDGRAHDEVRISLQDALEEALPPDLTCERELPITFAGSLLAPPEPPSEIGAAKDVCARGTRDRRLDMLLRRGSETIALEVKHRRMTEWSGRFCDGSALLPRKKVDTYGYYFLKDLHRLERLLHVETTSGPCVPSRRFAMFLSNDPYEFDGQVPHDALKLTRRSLERGHTVQYNRFKPSGKPTSPNTLWISYPPFCLAGSYEMSWQDLQDDVSRFESTIAGQPPFPTSRLLLVEVLSGLNDGIPIS